MGFGGKKKSIYVTKDDDMSSVTSGESTRGSRGVPESPRHVSENRVSGNLEGSPSGGISGSANAGVGGGLQRFGTMSRSFVHKRMVRDSLGPRFPDSERGESRQRASFLMDSAQAAEENARLSDLGLGSGSGTGSSGGGGNANAGMNATVRMMSQSGATTPRGNANGGSPKMGNFQKAVEGKFSKTPRATLTDDAPSDGDQTPSASERNKAGAGERNLDDKWTGSAGKMSKKKSVFNSIIFSKHRNKR